MANGSGMVASLPQDRQGLDPRLAIAGKRENVATSSAVNHTPSPAPARAALTCSRTGSVIPSPSSPRHASTARSAASILPALAWARAAGSRHRKNHQLTAAMAAMPPTSTAHSDPLRTASLTYRQGVL